MFTVKFWIDASERAVKTAAQAVLAAGIIGEGFNAFTVDWSLLAGFGAGGAVLSLLTSIGSTPFGWPGTPSLVDGSNLDDH